jgi:hypothetical protein
MPSVMALTGFYAFLIAVYAIGTWGIVTIGNSGALPIDDAWRGLGLLTGFIGVVGIFTYLGSALD